MGLEIKVREKKPNVVHIYVIKLVTANTTYGID
jgi:hypothetical protein